MARPIEFRDTRCNRGRHWHCSATRSGARNGQRVEAEESGWAGGWVAVESEVELEVEESELLEEEHSPV